jgi:hypothetical protein
MAKFLHVEVTQADIAKAEPKASGRCVVATAIARTIPDATRIEVDVQTVRFTRDGERHVFVTPYPVSGYVVAFDAGDEIHPFTFRLNESARVGMKRHTKTDAGKAVDRTGFKVRARQAKVDQLALPPADPSLPPPSPAERKVAKQRLVEAKAEHDSVKAAYEGQPKGETGPGMRKTPKRSVYKTGKRAYGQRLMRINQDR